MDFSWSEEQLQLHDEIVEFARDELNYPLTENDKTSSFDGEGWLKIARKGILGASFPSEYGGSGRDPLTAVLMLEALGYGCRDNGLTYAVNSQIWSVQDPILRFGTEEQRSAWLPSLLRGEVVGAFAMTEPSSGSDAFSMKTTATKTSDGYILNGHKTFITLGPICDVAVIFASTNPDHGQWGISAFLVDGTSRGMHRPGSTGKMGLRTAPIGDIILADCWVPETSLLGPEGAGASIFSDTLVWERGLIMASQVGAMERQLEDTISYVRSREQFGRPVGRFQSVSNRIVDMKLRLDVSRQLLYRMAWHKSTGRADAVDAALTKLFVSEAFVESSLDSIRNHGGVGYLTDFEVERDLRDAVGGLIYSGTSDIQKQVAARLLGL